MSNEVAFRLLTERDCTSTLLDNFNRYQIVEQSWRKVDGEWALVDTPFEEDWDGAKRQRMSGNFKSCIQNGGRVMGCFDNGRLIGWACVQKELFGSTRQYVNLDYLHVSAECRNRGLGKVLFAHAASIATDFGATKLYISSQSSRETQAFYKSVGCHEAEEIDPVLFEKESYDCHLEFIL